MLLLMWLVRYYKVSGGGRLQRHDWLLIVVPLHSSAALSHSYLSLCLMTFSEYLVMAKKAEVKKWLSGAANQVLLSYRQDLCNLLHCLT